MAKPSHAELVAAADTLRSAHIAADLARSEELEATRRRVDAEEHVREAAQAYHALTNALVHD